MLTLMYAHIICVLVMDTGFFFFFLIGNQRTIINK